LMFLRAMRYLVPTDGLLKLRHLDDFLSSEGQRVFRAMYGVYWELLQTVEKAGLAIFTQRIRGSKWRLSVMGVYSVLKGIS